MANPETPILVSPINGILIPDNTPTLSFIIPSDVDNNNLVFQIELDTHNPIQPLSLDYLKYESRLGEGNFKYWNGAGYSNIETGGVDSSAYGKTATITIPSSDILRNAIWFWQISVSDSLGTILYGETATFGFNLFG